ncbi:hypothetical protein Dsin_016214 [Dipteronia sinensis]|uniref:Uncharacterized protein n=1 Tax=Dipteronia sinensis TaxID=43782 RepID=A0AAE0E6R0_9ROSI|nr:hypothetical protein Dsin_016214 [Dipteronia sinensis]
MSRDMRTLKDNLGKQPLVTNQVYSREEHGMDMYLMGPVRRSMCIGCYRHSHQSSCSELHKLGRHNVFQSNSRIVPLNVSSTFSTGNDQYGTTCKQQVQGMNCMFKWKELEKNNGIYANWIEDAPLLHSSSNYVEN